VSPAALDKAKSLHRFAADQGAPLDTFQLVLTEPEAMELMEWYVDEYGGANEMLELDAAEARRTRNPWDLLANFTCMGLAMARANLVLN
jgi:hypothetical protein